MAKLLLVGNTNEIADANENDIIAVYDDSQELGKKEKECVDSGRFKIIQIEDTFETVKSSMQSIYPEIKECWYDADSETWKDLKSRPRFAMNYSDGLTHNFKTDSENNSDVNSEKISSLEAELAAAKIVEVTKG